MLPTVPHGPTGGIAQFRKEVGSSAAGGNAIGHDHLQNFGQEVAPRNGTHLCVCAFPPQLGNGDAPAASNVARGEAGGWSPTGLARRRRRWAYGTTSHQRELPDPPLQFTRLRRVMRPQSPVRRREADTSALTLRGERLTGPWSSESHPNADRRYRPKKTWLVECNSPNDPKHRTEDDLVPSFVERGFRSGLVFRRDGRGEVFLVRGRTRRPHVHPARVPDGATSDPQPVSSVVCLRVDYLRSMTLQSPQQAARWQGLNES